jgi:hypothetical protein
MESHRQASIEFRDELLAHNWPDDDGVRALTGAQEGDSGSSYISTLRAEGMILGLWSHDHRAFFYPDFQFDQRGCIRPEVAQLLSVLPNCDDRGGWTRAFWLYSPHALLDEEAPAEVFTMEPERVIEVAKREFSGGTDSGW